MSSAGHVYDLLGAYALGCLEGEEQSLVETHLLTCSTCQMELEAYRSVVADLPLAVIQRDPPPELKARLLDRVSKRRQPVRPVDKRPWWLVSWEALRLNTPAWGFASLVVMMVLGLGNLLLWIQLSEAREVTVGELPRLVLTATDASPGAVGVLVLSQNGEYGTLVVDGLPELSPAEQYQLWLIRDGQRTSGGVFSVDDEGYGSLVVESPEALLSYSAFGVTVEPAGGSPGPTGSKVLGTDL